MPVDLIEATKKRKSIRDYKPDPAPKMITRENRNKYFKRR